MKTDRIKDYCCKGLPFDPFCTNRLLSDYIKEDTFALAAVVHSLETVLFLQRYQRKSKRSADTYRGVVFSKGSFYDMADFHTHLLQRSYVTLTPSFPLIPNTFPKSWPWMNSGQCSWTKASGQYYRFQHNEPHDDLPRRDADWIIRYFLRYPKAERRRFAML